VDGGIGHCGRLVVSRRAAACPFKGPVTVRLARSCESAGQRGLDGLIYRNRLRTALVTGTAVVTAAVLSFAALAFASVSVPEMPKTALPGQQLALHLAKRTAHACTVWMEQSRRVTDKHQIPARQLTFTIKTPDRAGKATLHVQCGKLSYRSEIALVTPAPTTGAGTVIPVLGRSGAERSSARGYIPAALTAAASWAPRSSASLSRRTRAEVV
jgi:hypothetical protein